MKQRLHHFYRRAEDESRQHSHPESPVSPAYGDKLEVSTLSPGTQDQPWFGLRPYRKSLLEQGSFPCADILYEALMQMTNQLGFYGCTIQSQLQICLIGKTITLLTERLPPHHVTELFPSVFATHHPSWADIYIPE